jgi:hypothetical protein
MMRQVYASTFLSDDTNSESLETVTTKPQVGVRNTVSPFPSLRKEESIDLRVSCGYNGQRYWVDLHFKDNK